jgi:hypothetical protein
MSRQQNAHSGTELPDAVGGKSLIARTHAHQLPLVVALALALVFVPAGLAAKGGGGTGGGGNKPGGGSGTGTVKLVVVSSPYSDGLPHWGGQVTYTVSTTATTQPYVSTTCYQGSALVLGTSAGFFPSYPWQSAQVVPLQTQVWTGGAADCTAKLYSMNGGRQTTLSTLSFHVYP